MSEKLNTFIVTESGDFIINQNGKIIIAKKEAFDSYLILQDDIFTPLGYKDLVKLFNLDLEVENEN